MTTFKKLSYQNLCRLCISSNEPAVDLFADNGRSIAKISSCLSLKVDENDLLPKTICGRCATRLDECYDFRESCRNAEATLLAFVASLREAASTPVEQATASTQPMQVCDGSKAWSDATAMTLDNEAESIDVITPTVQLLAPQSAHPVSAQQRDDDAGLDEMMLREDVCELVNSWRLENSTDKRNGSFDYINSLKPNSLDTELAPLSNFSGNRFNNSVFSDSRVQAHNDRNYYQMVKQEDVLDCGQEDPAVWALPTTSTPSQLSVDDVSSGISSGSTVMTGNAMAVSPSGDIIFLDVIKGNILNIASNSESKIYIVNEEVGTLGEDTLSGLGLEDNVGRAVQTVALPDSTSTSAFPALPPHNSVEKPPVAQVPVNPPVRKKPPPPPEPREFPCPHCHRVFTKATQLAVHRAIHTGEKAHKCDECDKRYFRKEHLSRHVLAAHRPPSGEEFSCPDCGKVFHRKENFTRHTKMHRTYTCEKCQKVLENNALYIHHKNSDCGKKQIDPPPPPRPKAVHVCEVCKKEFSAPYRLRKHERTHLPRPTRSRTKGSRKNSEPAPAEPPAENDDHNSTEMAEVEAKETDDRIDDKSKTCGKEKEDGEKVDEPQQPTEEKSPVPV